MAKILIVDDEPRIRDLIREHLQYAGFTCEEAGDGTAALSNKGIALSREKILQKVWNYDYYGEDRTVDTHVKMLRGHLGACRKMIVTVWGIGYKFDPDAV